MSRHHPVKPRKKRRQHEQHEPEQKSFEERYRDAVKETADELYKQRQGASIDAAIRRAERTLALYDKDLEEQLGEGDSSRRWKITPTASLQWQRELERQQKRKEDLYQECWKLGRRMVDDWMQAENQPAQGEAAQPAPSVEVFHEDETHPTVNIERRQADAGHSGA